jgi:hypothetical protein
MAVSLRSNIHLYNGCDHPSWTLIGQLVEQSLGVFEVGGVEAFGEPTVDCGEHRPRLLATTLRHEQSREADSRTQIQ